MSEIECSRCESKNVFLNKVLGVIGMHFIKLADGTSFACSGQGLPPRKKKT